MSKTKQAPAGPIQPRAITLIGSGVQIMQQATILIRAGYFPDPQAPVLVFPDAGTMQMHLIPGTPDAAYADAAAVALNEASQREHAAYLRDVEEAAKRQIEAAVKADAAAKVAALLEQQKLAVAKLEAEIAAAAVQ